VAYTSIMPTPETVTLPNLAKFRPGRPVLQDDLLELTKTINYVYGRQGARCPGMCFDPYWSSLDYALGGSAYHTVGSTSNSYNLDDWGGIVRFQRRTYDSGNHGYDFALNSYAKNLDLRLTMRRLDTEDGLSSSFTDFTGLTTSHASADSSWEYGNLFFTEAQASRGGSTANGLAFFLLYLEAKVPASGTGQLWTFAPREIIMPTSGISLPRSQ
jgi:hypothetical protein